MHGRILYDYDANNQITDNTGEEDSNEEDCDLGEKSKKKRENNFTSAKAWRDGIFWSSLMLSIKLKAILRFTFAFYTQIKVD